MLNSPKSEYISQKKVLVECAEQMLRSQKSRERNQRGLLTLHQPWFVFKLRETCHIHKKVPGGGGELNILGQIGGVKYYPWHVWNSKLSSKSVSGHLNSRI